MHRACHFVHEPLHTHTADEKSMEIQLRLHWMAVHCKYELPCNYSTEYLFRTTPHRYSFISLFMWINGFRIPDECFNWRWFCVCIIGDQLNGSPFIVIGLGLTLNLSTSRPKRYLIGPQPVAREEKWNIKERNKETVHINHSTLRGNILK